MDRHSAMIAWFVIGTFMCCSNVVALGTCNGTSCPLENTLCDDNNTCQCIEGFKYSIQSDICIKVLGSLCLVDKECQFIENAECGTGQVCKCKDGFSDVDSMCNKVIGRQCSSDQQCPLVDSLCGTSGECVCSDQHPLYKDRCLRTGCHIDIQQLPNIDRRSMNFTAMDTYGLNDIQLEEKWYSLGPRQIPAISGDVMRGQCGTFYPILLTSNMTEEEVNSMREEEISVEAGIYDEEFGLLTKMMIELRQCGTDIQAYLKTPAISMAAYCVGNDMMPTKTPDYVNYVHTVRQRLNFRLETIEGALMNVPFITFECGIYSYSTSDNIFISWYIDDILFRKYGPLTHNSLHEGFLNETDILDANITLGFQIQCLVDQTDMHGYRSLYHSRKSLTGLSLDNHGYIWSEGTLQPYMFTPLGCESHVNDTAWNCTTYVPVLAPEGNLACLTANDDWEVTHPFCRIAVFGITKAGLDHQMYGHYSQYELYRSTYYANNTHIEEYHGTRFTEQNTTSKKYQAKFGTMLDDLGHSIWNGYTIPDSVLRQRTLHGGNFYVSGSSFWKSGFMQLPMTSVGEFTVVRSRTLPVELHIKTEVRGSSIELCGLVFRNGNSIYMDYRCNGIIIEGNLHGNESHPYSGMMSPYGEGVVAVNDMSIYWYSYGYQLYVNLFSSASSEMFEETEGIVMFEDGRFPHRDGSIVSNSDGFIDSWRVRPDESLLNPRNHIPFSYNTSSYQCGCPSKNEDIPERELISEWSSNRVYNVYYGTIECSTEYECVEHHTGNEWIPSLLPDYVLQEIKVTPDMSFSEMSVSSVVFHCTFDAVGSYMYKIMWLMNGGSVKASGFLLANELHDFDLREEFVQSETSLQFLLDVEIVCAVSVYDLNATELLPVQYSNAFIPLKVLNPEVNILRGGDAIVTLQRNIPFGCPGGSQCQYRVLLYDPDDKYDCKDSTVAIKSSSTCGVIIHGTSSPSEVTTDSEQISITVTTKNNNKYTLRQIFTLRLAVALEGMENTLYTGNHNSSITVFVRDDAFWQRKYCYVNNDPRMGTLDGIHYSNQLVDEFIMYRHRQLPVEVQMQTMLCNGGWAACSCAVTVRAGRDIFTINHCHGEHITGFLKNDENILSVHRRSANHYQIYLPHGTLVDIQVSPWQWYMVNANIYPSPSDVGQIEGLCGNFNGIVNDDFTHRDGTVDQIQGNWWYTSPDDFSMSWGLHSADVWFNESLLNPDRPDDTIWGWEADEQLCICPRANISGEALCSPNEEETCIHQTETSGTSAGKTYRTKRDVFNLDQEINSRLRDLNKVANKARGLRKRETNENAIPEEEALDMCTTRMSSDCPLFNIRNNTPASDIEQLILNCARDTAINPEVDWSGETCTRIQGVVETQVAKDVEFQENNSEVVEFMKSHSCIGNCTGNGQCVGVDTCYCYDGYGADDCSIDLSHPPKVTGIQGNGLCDLSKTSDCTCIRLATSGHIETTHCTMDVFVAGQNGTFIYLTTERPSAVYENYNELYCCNTHRRSKRSQSNVLATQYDISVSNDGTTFSNSERVNILDSTCVQIVDDRVYIKTGYCFIGGNCIYEDAKNPADKCETCQTEIDIFSWSRGPECELPIVEADKDDSWKVYAMAAGGVIVAGVLVVIAIMLRQNFQRKRVASQDERFDGARVQGQRKGL